jgi:S-adenosyl-L-methionine hydrolase (adenosine-forming)
MSSGPSVFFLSDYGTQDEFVGVVHAVLSAGAPESAVIDLTHQIPPFDVRAGAHALARAVPHLPAGIVLAVVDPGVGTVRRGLCLRVDAVGGPTLFVGPDNGLLVKAAEMAGGGAIAEVVALHPLPPSPERGDTFDGRDLFAPAVARLCGGTDPGQLGQPVEPSTLVRLFDGVVEPGRGHDGRSSLRCEVTWVDRFGNVQLAATAADGRAAGLPRRGVVEVSAFGSDGAGALPGGLVPEGTTVRCVDAFADLAHGELGLLLDANGRLAVVAGEASAAHWLNVTAGELLVLSW